LACDTGRAPYPHIDFPASCRCLDDVRRRSSLAIDTSYDLAILDQAVWHLSRLEAPASTVSGLSSVLGDHFSPVIVLFAPLYWVAPRPELLIGMQAVLFAAAIFPIFLFLRSRLPAPAALAFSTSAILFWGIQRAASSDVHEVAFAPLLIATAILAMDRRWWRVLWAALVLLVCVKEDLIPFVAGFGIYLAARGDRRIGLALIAFAVTAWLLVMHVAIPAFNDGAQSAYLAPYQTVVTRPFELVSKLVTPTIKLRTIGLWLAPFLFLSLGSPLALLIVPIAVSRLLSDSPLHWGPGFHYSAPLAPLVAMSAGDGLARLMRRLAARGASRDRIAAVTNALATAVLILAAILPGRQPIWRVFAPSLYVERAAHRSSEEALARIHAGESVLAQSAVLPHLSQRQQIFVLGRPAPETDYVVANRDLNPWPARSFDDLQRLLAVKTRSGYLVDFERQGWIVLKRRAGPITPSAAPE
jgi:uncharacterized membrane protein